eukprot:CAMPEP_0195073090 /NCGR_PEP_ID=MMETSP0448-20130528/16504_1 /TAXON_ID=66468 /ORGANISM="Heterocapsa triquestra, Strain CCMP 448" /LENGTH=65 /DNA_ID=CAMNT_0040105159 /DNA_START=77 /DNA_END=271 /DNA_ORIENTATION=-
MTLAPPAPTGKKSVTSVGEPQEWPPAPSFLMGWFTEDVTMRVRRSLSPSFFQGCEAAADIASCRA